MKMNWGTNEGRRQAGFSEMEGDGGEHDLGARDWKVQRRSWWWQRSLNPKVYFKEFCCILKTYPNFNILSEDSAKIYMSFDFFFLREAVSLIVTKRQSLYSQKQPSSCSPSSISWKSTSFFHCFLGPQVFLLIYVLTKCLSGYVF